MRGIDGNERSTDCLTLLSMYILSPPSSDNHKGYRRYYRHVLIACGINICAVDELEAEELSFCRRTPQEADIEVWSKS